MIDTIGYSYLGTTIEHPIKLLVGGRPVLGQGRVSVEQSIRHLLDTPKGSLFFKPEYGSDLKKLIFRQNDESLWNLLKAFIKEALLQEGRIEVLGVSVQADGESCLCFISYRFKGMNEINSMVYPFYRNL
jgi:phage baseplate assembly protein W